MAAKKKSPVDNQARGMNQKGKVVQWDKPGTRKPTEAFVNPGQTPTGLAKSTVKNRFSSTAKTPVSGAESGLRGTGTPTGASFAISRPTNKRNLLNAALMISAIPTGAAKSGLISRSLQKRYGGAAGEGAFGAAAKGLDAPGIGGKIKVAQTVKGPVNASTKVGSPAQWSARMENLTSNARRIATASQKSTASQIAKDLQVVKKLAKGSAGIAAAGSAVQKTKKKK